jgi:hypothetical protein
MTGGLVVIHGDFGCPWSLLAARRARLLEALGVRIDWRAVGSPGGPSRFGDLRREAAHVLAWLLPDERLPYTLAGFATDSRAATRGYAEAYLAGAASPARSMLFAAFWNHSIDLADPAIVQTLLDEAIRGPRAASDPGAADALVHDWEVEVGAGDDRTLPIVSYGTTRLSGTAAIEWLGGEVLRNRSAPSSCA